MLKPIPFIAAILLLATAPSMASPARSPLPENGILDLRNMDPSSFRVVNLNGEWEFYWEQLLTIGDYHKARKSGSGILVTVPSYWKNYSLEDGQPSGEGYGTYALTLLLPEGYHGGICIDIPVFDVAYRFYVNERLVGSNGVVGTSREEENPWYEPRRFCYEPDRDTLQLLIQVSNFHHRRGGFWQSVLVGKPDALLKRSEKSKMISYTTTGILFFFSLFYLIFWLFFRHDRTLLIFSLVTLGILIRTVNTGFYLSNTFLYTPWTWQIRMEYFGTYLGFLFGTVFLHRIFPRSYMNPVVRANSFLSGLLVLSVFLLPPRYFSYGMLVFQPLIVLLLLHYLAVSFRGTLRGKLSNVVFFISLALFLVTLVNDILLANTAGSVSSNYLSQVSFQVFILSMAVLTIKQVVDNYNARVKLEASLRFKNKVLSVIAHDLKNPVASIAQFVDLLEAKPELTRKPRVIRSLQESSRSAVDLLDNLLYWGRSQTDELTVTLVEADLSEVALEIEALFGHMASQKEISLRTQVSPGTMVLADRSLLHIVIRNLVSNALKFTSSGGEVSLEASQDDDQMVITVTDTGIGIKPSILDQLEQGGQIPSSPGTGKERGTGLGLQLVRDLVEKSNGTLAISSVPGKGSVFTIRLPGVTQKKTS